MSRIGEPVRVLKLNPDGEVTWQYEGHLLRREENAVVLEALFNHPDVPFVDVVFKRNDRFVEIFYTDRWYNVFSIYDRDDGKLKGWYCNVARPAIVDDGTVSYVDLALDLWISATGEQTVLDWDEFEALNLSPVERDKALAALSQLQEFFKSQRPPQ